MTNPFEKTIRKQFKSMRKYEVGMVLGGGGARGFAHLGVLQALKEKGIEPDIISGVSAGAIIGAFIASGKAPYEVHELLKNKGLLNYSRLNIPRQGLLSLEGLEEELKRSIQEKDIGDFKIPFFAAVSNLNKGKAEYISEGPVHKVVIASASIPILFSPVALNGDLYVDGGLFDNLPGMPLLGKCKKTVGVMISQIKPSNELTNLIRITTRVFQLAINSNSTLDKNECDLLIEPEGLEKYDILDTDRADELFDTAYEYTRKLKTNI